jgi:hypothetical protein
MLRDRIANDALAGGVVRNFLLTEVYTALTAFGSCCAAFTVSAPTLDTLMGCTYSFW